jgi:hypothetical protein
MDKLAVLQELDKLDIVEEFINCAMWLSKYTKDFKNDNALNKAYGIWEKNMALRSWLRKNTLKSQYQLWIGKIVKPSQKIPTKGSTVVFSKEKNAYTWSSSKRYAVSNIQNNPSKSKGSYLIRVYTTKDEVIFDVYAFSKLQLSNDDVSKLIDNGMSSRKANLLKEVLDELSKDSFKEIVICNDVVNTGMISAVWDNTGNTEGNWRSR